ncbi:MAG: hypothetical protein U9N79_01790 [Actinomycetota bacterium]|nr:hypothetical protein [Actinomycetota bacterium]
MNMADNSGFAEALDRHFPGAILEAEFIAGTAQRLGEEGFSKANTIACVALCRDEITRPLFTDVERFWGPAFSFAGLAGMVTAGRTGLAAAIHHAPIEDARRRFVIYAMAHIAIDADGTIGRIERPGIPEPSSACGALVAFRDELRAGTLEVEFDRYDTEQSLLKHRLLPLIKYGNVPDLVDLTKLTVAAIEEDLHEILRSLADGWRATGHVMPADMAIFGGVQIHGANGVNFVWPLSARIELDGDLRDYRFTAR